MHEKCLFCNRRASILNLKNLQCSECKKLCHPKCTRNIPPICIKKDGNFRYKIIRNKNWKCDRCNLRQLPFSNLSRTQVRLMREGRNWLLSSVDDLNDLFVNENPENDDEFEFTYFSKKTQYKNSQNVDSFKEESDMYDDFPILSINVRSIVNRDHFTKFEALLDSLPNKPMVIGLTETWVTDDSTTGPFLNLPGYHPFIQNHRHRFGGGGVGFYISEHLHYSVIDDMNIMEEKLFESLFVSVDINGKDVICGTIYRKSQNTGHDFFITNIKRVLKKCEKMNKSTVVMGDLNYDLLDTDNIHVNCCVDTFFENGFYPLINIPTRITDTTATVLDHLWTNIVETPIKSAVLVDQIADHLPVYMSLAIGKPRTSEKIVVEKRCFFLKELCPNSTIPCVK